MNGVVKNITVLLRFSAYRMMCVRGVGTAFETFVLFCRIALYDNSFAAFLQFHIYTSRLAGK